MRAHWVRAHRPWRETLGDVDWVADPDWEFRTAPTLPTKEVRLRYPFAGERRRAVATSAASLDQLPALPRRDGRSFSLRWVLLHLIEVTARHAGRADLLRDALDGTFGE